MALNPKQKLFVQEYLVDKNATRAAKAAGYSDATAYAMGAENLKKPQIKRAIAAELKKTLNKIEVTGARVIEELAKIAFHDHSKKVKSKEQFLKSALIKTSDKVKSLEILAKYFKLLTDVHEHSARDGGPIVVLTMGANDSEASRNEGNGPSQAG